MSNWDPSRPATERKLRSSSRRSGDGFCEEIMRRTSEQSFGHDGPTIASLPCGVLSHIFDGLGPRDLASASCVCRSWRRLVALEAAANQVWRSFYSARWQLSGARWPSRPPFVNNSHGGTSASLPISLPGSSGNDGGIGEGSSSSSGACTLGSSTASRSSSSAAATPSGSPEMRWQWAYGSKMLRIRSWSGRYSADQVVGHKMAVRAVRLLPACNLMATASLDRTVRLWDLRSGLPLGHSRPHGGIVRCLALDTGLLASGSSDSLVRVWRPQSGSARGGGLAEFTSLFGVSSKPHILRGHGGPVSCLALDESPAAAALCRANGGSGGGEVYTGTLFSGSWDCTVRIWRQGASDNSDGGDDGGVEFSDASGGIAGSSGDERVSIRREGAAQDAAMAEDGGWSCAGVLQYSDWVYCCAVRGGNLLVAAGSEVVVTDAATGRAVRRFADVHDGAAVACLEGCRSGRLLFTASGDGLLLAHDLRMKQGSRVLWHHNAAVTGLAFEDPWLASSSADGCIILQDSEQALAGGSSPQRALSASCRALHCPAGQPALSLDLADQWLAAGTESGVVRLWDFTGAAAAAERAAAARAARSAAKASRAVARKHQPQPHVTPPSLPQPYLQPRRHRGKRHEQQQQQHLPPETAAQPHTNAVESAAAVDGQMGENCSGGPHTDSTASVPTAATLSRRSGRGSGGGGGGSSSDRWRHHGSSHPGGHGPFCPRAREPRPPPPPAAPAFRYVGSGAGGGAGVGPGASGMATFSAAGQQRLPRPQRQ